MRAFIPLHEGDKSSPFFRTSAFTYEAQRDEIHLSAG